MDILELREYCLSMEGVTEKTPFGKFASRYDSILVFYILDHLFCLVDMDDFRSVTVKLKPDKIDELKTCRASVSKPVNLSERHWIQIDLNGDISDREIYTFIKKSYDIVKSQYSGKTLRRRL